MHVLLQNTTFTEGRVVQQPGRAKHSLVPALKATQAALHPGSTRPGRGKRIAFPAPRPVDKPATYTNCSTAKPLRQGVDPEHTAQAVATSVTATVLVFINQLRMEIGRRIERTRGTLCECR